MSVVKVVKETLSFDTRQGSPNYEPNPNIAGYHSWNTRVPIAIPVKNVRKLSLKELTMPLSYNRFRPTNGSNVLYIAYIGSGYNLQLVVKIPAGNYATGAALASAINTAITSALTPYPGIYIGFYANTDSNGFTYMGFDCLDAAGFYQDSFLSKDIMGLKGGYMTSGGDDAIFPLNLNPDLYFNMCITNVNKTPNANGSLNTFKIPLSVSPFQTLVYQGGSSDVIELDEPADFSFLNVVILDRWGFPVYGYNYNFQFVLGIERWEIEDL